MFFLLTSENKRCPILLGLVCVQHRVLFLLFLLFSVWTSLLSDIKKCKFKGRLYPNVKSQKHKILRAKIARFSDLWVVKNTAKNLNNRNIKKGFHINKKREKGRMMTRYTLLYHPIILHTFVKLRLPYKVVLSKIQMFKCYWKNLKKMSMIFIAMF